MLLYSSENYRFQYYEFLFYFTVFENKNLLTQTWGEGVKLCKNDRKYYDRCTPREV